MIHLLRQNRSTKKEQIYTDWVDDLILYKAMKELYPEEIKSEKMFYALECLCSQEISEFFPRSAAGMLTNGMYLLN